MQIIKWNHVIYDNEVYEIEKFDNIWLQNGTITKNGWDWSDTYR